MIHGVGQRSGGFLKYSSHLVLPKSQRSWRQGLQLKDSWQIQLTPMPGSNTNENFSKCGSSLDCDSGRLQSCCAKLLRSNLLDPEIQNSKSYNLVSAFLVVKEESISESKEVGKSIQHTAELLSLIFECKGIESCLEGSVCHGHSEDARAASAACIRGTWVYFYYRSLQSIFRSNTRVHSPSERLGKTLPRVCRASWVIKSRSCFPYGLLHVQSIGNWSINAMQGTPDTANLRWLWAAPSSCGLSLFHCQCYNKCCGTYCRSLISALSLSSVDHTIRIMLISQSTFGTLWRITWILRKVWALNIW